MVRRSVFLPALLQLNVQNDLSVDLSHRWPPPCTFLISQLLVNPSVSPACALGGVISPALGSTVSLSPSTPLTVSWDPTCFTTQPSEIDIYLFSSGNRLHIWRNVSTFPGTLDVHFLPAWWGADPSLAIQLQLLPSGLKPFESQLPAGPLLTVTYNEDQTVSAGSNSTVTPQSVNTTKGGMSAGGLAAAIGVPIFVVGIAINRIGM